MVNLTKVKKAIKDLEIEANLKVVERIWDAARDELEIEEMEA